MKKKLMSVFLAAMLSVQLCGVAFAGDFSAGVPVESVSVEEGNSLSEQPIENAGVQKKDFTVKNSVLTKYTGKSSKVVIPSNLGIKKIGVNAFSFNMTIKEVVIPKGVTEISAKAFLGCEKLKKVSVPATVKTIGYNTFSGTPWLKSLGNTAVVNSILISVAHVNQSTLTIPYGVTRVSDYLFEGKRGCYENLVVPETVKKLQFCSIQGGFKTIKILSRNVVLDKDCGASDCTIYGFKGSTAEAYVKKYGKEKNIVFKVLSNTVHTHRWESKWKKLGDANVFEGQVQYRKCTKCSKKQFRHVGKALKSTIKVSATNIKMKRNKTSNALRVTAMANGDYIGLVESTNENIVKAVKFDRYKGTITLKTYGKKGKAKLTIILAGGAKKTVEVTVV